MVCGNNFLWNGEIGHFIVEDEPKLAGANFTAKVGVDCGGDCYSISILSQHREVRGACGYGDVEGRTLSVVLRGVGGRGTKEQLAQHRDCCLVQHEVSHLHSRGRGGTGGWGRGTNYKTARGGVDQVGGGGGQGNTCTGS